MPRRRRNGPDQTAPGRRRRSGARAVFRAITAAAVLLLGLSSAAHSETARSVRRKMGSRFEVTAVHPDAATAWRAVEAAYAEIDRLESLISEWIETSEVSAVNRSAGQRPVRVSPEVLALVQRALSVSRLTGGAFDVTFLSVGRLWDFKAAQPTRPSPAAIREALAAVGSDQVVVDAAAGTIFLRHPRTRIGFGAIGKGWAANEAVSILRRQGATGGAVNAFRAHTIAAETHFRLPLTTETWLFPILRYHQQTASDYFGPTGSFTGGEEFFISDWDLAEISTTKVGLGLRGSAAPGRSWALGLRRYELRFALFSRDDGLDGMTVSLGLGWSL